MAEEPLTDLESSLRLRISDLEAIGIGYALVGGLAVSVRAEPRLTRDTDFAISVTNDAEAEEVVRGFSARHYTPVSVVEQEATGRLATVRLSHEADSGVVDLLFASCGVEPEIVAASDQIEVLADLLVWVATTAHLLSMKLLARDDRRRPADADDLGALAAGATDADWDEALETVRLIARRGYHRGRDLEAALVRLRESGPYP